MNIDSTELSGEYCGGNTMPLSRNTMGGQTRVLLSIEEPRVHDIIDTELFPRRQPVEYLFAVVNIPGGWFNIPDNIALGDQAGNLLPSKTAFRRCVFDNGKIKSMGPKWLHSRSFSRDRQI